MVDWGGLREDVGTAEVRVWLRTAGLSDSDKATRYIALTMLATIVFAGQLLARQLEGDMDTANDDRVVGAELGECTVPGSTISDAVALVINIRAEDG